MATTPVAPFRQGRRPDPPGRNRATGRPGRLDRGACGGGHVHCDTYPGGCSCTPGASFRAARCRARRPETRRAALRRLPLQRR